jgi:hypothetical protein
MEKTYKSKYQTIIFDELTNFLMQSWSENTNLMQNKDFEKEMMILADFIEQLQPKHLLIDMQNFLYIVTPQMQKWVNENVNSKLLKTNSKVAFVGSEDMFVSIAVQQTLEENEGKDMNRKYFNNKEDAMRWLL